MNKYLVSLTLLASACSFEKTEPSKVTSVKTPQIALHEDSKLESSEKENSLKQAVNYEKKRTSIQELSTV